MNESSEMFKDYTEILLSLLHQLIAAMNMQIIHLPVILKSLLTILVKIYARNKGQIRVKILEAK